MKMKSLAEVLVKEGLITEEQLQDAREKQVGAKRPLQELLVEMGYISEEDLMRISSRVFNMPITKLKDEAIDMSALEVMSYETARRYGVFPLRKEGNTLVLAVSDPMDIITLDDIRAMTKMNVKPLLSAKSDIVENIEKYYNSDEVVYDLLKNMVEDTRVEITKKERKDEKFFDIASISSEDSPVVKLVNRILSDAVKARASDVHIEPQENSVKVRYRVDGDLRNIMDIPNQFRLTIAARAKVMADMDLAERRKPQDGRIELSAYGRNIDLRVSTIPTHYGEKIVLRLLDPKEAKIRLDELGFEESNLNLFKEATSTPQGMVLVTGPTSSGKTSTLYAALNYIKSETKNIITIEDPIEYLIGGINQMQVNPVKNVTFANGLRSILRQDPNVILVGEMRDKETAEITFRASLTGHLVLSSLHANSAVASIVRLLDIGVEPYLIASSIILIVAQRLVKIICPHCKKEEYIPEKKLRKRFKPYLDKLDIDRFYRGAGCEKCNFTGFLGRTGIFELLKFDKKIKELVANESPESAIFEEARKGGMKLLAETGMEKVARGITTLEEIARVVEVVEEREEVERVEEVREAPKILIADDEENILRVLENRLHSAGYEVVKARNGKEAVEYAVREKPDLIVMDIMMPEMDGFEATKTLRSKLETAIIPIMMLTAKKDEKSELKGIDLGADDYITKPFDGNRLLARVKMLLKRRYR